jgi:hypothetical protein
MRGACDFDGIVCVKYYIKIFCSRYTTCSISSSLANATQGTHGFLLGNDAVLVLCSFVSVIIIGTNIRMVMHDSKCEMM